MSLATADLYNSLYWVEYIFILPSSLLLAATLIAYQLLPEEHTHYNNQYAHQ